MSQCSVVIVSKRGGVALFATIESVLQQAKLAELILVDNGNPPDVLARLRQRALTDPRLKIVTGHGDVGYAKGCNIGARQAVSDFLLFLKAEYLLPPEALSTWMAALSSGADTVLATGWVQKPDGSPQGDIRVQPLTPAAALRALFSVSAQHLHLSKKPEKTTEVAVIPAACLCIRSGDYKKLGGLDETFTAQVEDVDFCMRVQTFGGKVLCVPSVQVTHLPHVSNEPQETLYPWHRAQSLLRYFNRFFAERLPVGALFVLNLLLLFNSVLEIVEQRLLQKSRTEAKLVGSDAAKRLMALALGPVNIPPTEQLKGRIILVTGATSQIGLCVVRRLIAAGAAVLALSRHDSVPYQHPHLRWIKGDLSDPTFNLQGYLADQVVHCAPLWHLPQVMKLLAEAEVKRVVAFGSTSMFTKLLPTNHFEKELVQKLQQAEASLIEKCTQKAVHYTILRPTLAYGLGLDTGISMMAKLIRRFKKIYVYPPAFGRRQPVHVDDLAIAALQVLEQETTYGKSYNLSGGEVLTYREMLERLFAFYGKKPRILESTALPFILDVAGRLLRKKYINGEIARRMNDDLVFFNDDAKRDFAFQPRKFLAGGLADIEGF